MSRKYFEGFLDRESVARGFEEGEGNAWDASRPFKVRDDFPTEDEILFACYDQVNYEGSALVLYRRGGKLYQVTGSHCSCYGLESQWEPDEVTAKQLMDYRPSLDTSEALVAWYAVVAKLNEVQEKFAGTTHYLVVLDQSASMGKIAHPTIDGFNEWLEGVQNLDPDGLVTVVLFDTQVKTLCAQVRARAVSRLTSRSTGAGYWYCPCGATALYDALAEAVRSAQDRVQPGDRSIVIVVTDGQENSSREMDKAGTMALIKDLEDRGNWTFTYLSAHPDAFGDAVGLGVRVHNTSRFVPNYRGTQAAWKSVLVGTEELVRGSLTSTNNFYGTQGTAG